MIGKEGEVEKQEIEPESWEGERERQSGYIDKKKIYRHGRISVSVVSVSLSAKVMDWFSHTNLY